MYPLTQIEQTAILLHLILASSSLGYIAAELVLSYIKYKVTKETANYPIGVQIVQETTSDILTLRSTAEVPLRDMVCTNYNVKERMENSLKRQLAKQIEEIIQITEDNSRYKTPNIVLQAELRVLKPRKGAE